MFSIVTDRYKTRYMNNLLTKAQEYPRGIRIVPHSDKENSILSEVSLLLEQSLPDRYFNSTNVEIFSVEIPWNLYLNKFRSPIKQNLWLGGLKATRQEFDKAIYRMYEESRVLPYGTETEVLDFKDSGVVPQVYEDKYRSLMKRLNHNLEDVVVPWLS